MYLFVQVFNGIAGTERDILEIKYVLYKPMPFIYKDDNVLTIDTHY